MTSAVRISEALRTAVEQFVVSQGCVTSSLVAERFNRTRRTAQRILASLRDEKRINGARVITVDGRRQPAVWTLSDHDQHSDQVKAMLDAEADDAITNLPGDGLPVVLHVSANAWRRGEAHRDPLDIALFGPAAAERIAA